MEKFDLTRAVAMAIYMCMEHELGKSEHGSVIGLAKNAVLCILKFIGSGQK